MADREAMRLALETLENNRYIIESEINPPEALEEVDVAIAVLRQALEQPDMGIDRGAWDDVPDATKWVDELRGGDETEQEPVAWMYVNRDGECEQIEFGTAFDDPSVTLLYAAPPKREWVGLADEDRYKAIRPLYDSDENARLAVEHSNDEYEAIEAKLKEKNT